MEGRGWNGGEITTKRTKRMTLVTIVKIEIYNVTTVYGVSF